MIFEPAAAAFADALLAVVVARTVAAGAGCAPMSCCRELNKLPNMFCVDPTGICAAVLLDESEAGSSEPPFLWPWPCG